MIKILHLTQVGGGVDRYIKLFLKNSDGSKFKHIVVAPYAMKNEENSTYKSYLIDDFRSISPLQIIKTVCRLREIVNNENPDIIYLHSSFAGVIGRLALFFSKKPIIYNPHGWSFLMQVSKYKRTVFKWIEYLLSFRTNAYVLISKSEFDAALNLGINFKKLNLVYNGIEIKNNPSRHLSKNVNTKKSYTIGMVGRISNQKNPLFFIEFAKRISTIFPDTQFIIVGDGELRGTVTKLIEEYGLSSKVKITGWVSNVEHYIEQFDQAVLFSKWEGFGYAVVEYMVQRKPTIISNVDGMSEIIDNEINGFKIDKFNLDQAVAYSLRIRNNVEEVKLLTDRAYQKVVEKFNISDNVSAQEEIFKELIGGS